MIEKIIEYSVRNRFQIMAATAALAVWGVYAVYHTPIDAIPDLSENQLIVFTDWIGPQSARNRGSSYLPVVVAIARARRREGGAVHERIQLLDDQRDLRRKDGILFRPAARLGAAGQYQRTFCRRASCRIWHRMQRLRAKSSGTPSKATGYDLSELRSIQDWFVRYQLIRCTRRGRSRVDRRLTRASTRSTSIPTSSAPTASRWDRL